MLNKEKSQGGNRKKSQVKKHRDVPVLQNQNNSAPSYYDQSYEGMGDNSLNDNYDDEFGNRGNNLYDYEENYKEDFKFTPERVQKPHFLSQGPRRNDYGGYAKQNAVSEAKLPPSLRWAMEEDSYDANDSPVYERNPKVNMHLKPIKNPLAPINVYKNGSPVDMKASVGTIYSGQDKMDAGIGRIPSIKKLSSQKTRRLQPLRK